MKKIRVAVVGVGNCATSLIEGVAIYKNYLDTTGLAFESIGSYEAGDIEFCLAFDIDTRKVGRPLKEAIYAKPNCGVSLFDHYFLDPFDKDNFLDSVCGDTYVKRGALYDGVAPHMKDYPENEAFRVTKDPEPSCDDIVTDLKENKIDVLLNYLPVGSEVATRFYVNACLSAKVAFVNCIPVFIVSDPFWEGKLKEAGIPAIGDDMKSALGASVLSQAIQELFFDRGMTVNFHSQTNVGGNTDFLNMIDQDRLTNKRISKENVIRSQNDIRGIPVPPNGIYAGPASYIPYQKDNKVAHFRVEAEGFGKSPVFLDARLSVQDSPNSAGVVIDAIRYLKVATEMGLVGSLRGPSAATQKTPPEQMMLTDAINECKMLANRELSVTVKEHNLI